MLRVNRAWRKGLFRLPLLYFDAFQPRRGCKITELYPIQYGWKCSCCGTGSRRYICLYSCSLAWRRFRIDISGTKPRILHIVFSHNFHGHTPADGLACILGSLYDVAVVCIIVIGVLLFGISTLNSVGPLLQNTLFVRWFKDPTSDLISGINILLLSCLFWCLLLVWADLGCLVRNCNWIFDFHYFSLNFW